MWVARLQHAVCSMQFAWGLQQGCKVVTWLRMFNGNALQHESMYMTSTNPNAMLNCCVRVAKDWVPGHVCLLAAAGKLTVTYVVDGYTCRKHLDPWSEQIRLTELPEEPWAGASTF